MTRTVDFIWDSTGKPFENNRYMLVAKVDAEGVQEYSLDNNVYFENIKARTLSVKRYEPGNNDTDVAIDTKVTLEFNMSIMEGDLYESIAFIDSLGNSVPFTKSLNETQLILTPSAKLKNNEAYAVQVPVDAVNGFDGCGMNQDYIMSFITEKLYTSPVVKFTYPAEDMADVALDSDINIRFSGNIKSGDQYAGIIVSDETGKTISMTKSIEGELLKIHPSGNLTNNTTYTVNLPAGAVAYTDGTLMEREYEFSFTTIDAAEEPKPDPDPDPKPQPGGSGAGTGAGAGENDEPVIGTEEGVHIVTISANVEPKGEAGIIKATVDNSTLESALGKVLVEMNGKAGAKGQIAIDLEARDANEIALQIPEEAIDKIAKTEGIELKINSGLATVKFDEKALDHISGTGATDKTVDNVSITIKKVNPDTLTKEARDKIGDRPVIDFKVNVGDKGITSFGGGNVSISIPYTPKPGENHNSIIIYYIDSTGNLSKGMGQYNAETGTVDFTTDHFSSYGVGYNEVKFTDVAENSWYNNAVGYLAARSMINGSGNGIFAPVANISRADFLIMVMNVYGIKLDNNITDNFADAGNKYYTPYLGTAKRLKLVSGGGNNLYSPEADISRQDMAAILYRILKQLDKLPTKKSYSFDKFRDTDSISGYAMESMRLFAETGILAGDGKNLNPRDTSTRAQAAQILYNLQK